MRLKITAAEATKQRNVVAINTILCKETARKRCSKRHSSCSRMVGAGIELDMRVELRRRAWMNMPDLMSRVICAVVFLGRPRTVVALIALRLRRPARQRCRAFDQSLSLVGHA